MKSAQSLRSALSMVVALVVLAGVTAGGAAVFAATGAVTSEPTPSDAAPDIGDSIDVTINIDMTGVDASDDYLGSFTGSLDWDPDVLAYDSNSGILAGFTGVVNTTNVATGDIIFNGANA
ncbi:MAG: hypothetical protein OEW09_04945, partial [Anaerolineae bacterium]|nr:hypothetical protein [Anaerolineae bacterium]